MNIKIIVLFNKKDLTLGWLFIGGVKKFVVVRDDEVLMIGARSVVKKYFDYLLLQ